MNIKIALMGVVAAFVVSAGIALGMAVFISPGIMEVHAPQYDAHVTDYYIQKGIAR